MVQIIFPLLDGITAFLLAGLEALKGYFGMKVSEYNCRIREMNFKDDKKRPIGFIIDQEEEEDDE